jgi:hypothetical protein
MKDDMDRRRKNPDGDKRKKNIFIGDSLIFLGMLIFIWESPSPTLTFPLKATGAIMVIAGLAMLEWGKPYLDDERTRKIRVYSLAYSFGLIFLAISILNFIKPEIFTQFNISDFLGILGITAALLYGVINWLLSRKGDVE